MPLGIRRSRPNPAITRPAAGTRSGPLSALWQHRDFRLLWLATIPSQLGQGMQQVALGWLVLELTGSGGMVGAIFAARSAPNLVVGLVAGSVTDRLDRRLLLRVSLAGMAAIASVVALLLFLDRLEVWHLMVFTFALGTLNAFETAARQVYVYDLVGGGEAVKGIAVVSLAQRTGGVIGALAAGGLLEWRGPGVSFLTMSVGYVLSAGALVWLRHAGAAAPLAREPMLQNIQHYFQALRSNRTMLTLMISTAAVEILGFSHQALLPVLALEVLHVGAGGLGVLTACRFLGGALGSAALTFAGAVRRRGWLLLGSVAAFGVAQVLLSQSPNFPVALALVTVVNIAASATDVLHQALFQLAVTNEQRGRAMGSWIVGIGTAPLGHLEAGYLGELTSLRLALVANGLALLGVGGIMAVLMPRLRRM